MKERPILFSAPMVRAILAGTKTQTRRVVAQANSLVNGGSFPRAMWPGLDLAKAWVDPGPSPAGNPGPYLKAPFALEPKWPAREEYVYRVYPRVQVGDGLWVRETWDYYGGGEYLYQQDRRAVMYAASPESVPGLGERRWRPSIFMPRWASRISLEISSVRVQHLHDISEEDARAEGFRDRYDAAPTGERDTAAEVFAQGWDSINGKRAPWASNPFVWVLSFRRVV